MLQIFVILSLAIGASLADPHFLSQDFIDQINEQQTGWRAGRNFPEDTPMSHFKALASITAYNNDPNFTIPTISHQKREDLPGSFDARTTWPNCGSISTIRNQGACGSCWAFGAVEVMSDRLCIFTAGAQQFTFSPEELVSCCTSCGNGCSGGSALGPFQYWQSTGIPSGGDQNSNQGCRPYTAATTGTTPQCNQRCVGDYGKEWKDDIRFGIAAYSISANQEDMKHEIVINGPIEVIFAVYEDFYNYQSGVYGHSSGNLVGYHAVKVLGYGNDNGQDYWLVANSWGSGWGESGFFKIKRGTNECEIESYPTAGIPQT